MFVGFVLWLLKHVRSTETAAYSDLFVLGVVRCKVLSY